MNVFFVRKTAVNLDPPPGFRGLDPDQPIEHYFRHLPHWRQEGATYFATWRLVDSLPQSKLPELQAFREQWHLRHGADSPTKTDQLAKEVMTRVEKWLDQGAGQCHLRKPSCANEVVKSLHYFDFQRYELNCFVVMPNHVHAILKPTLPKEYPLEKILQSCKRHTANRINKLLGFEGNFWQAETFDRIIRDEEHLYRAIQYIGRNPRMANLEECGFVLWIRPEWECIGWGFRKD